MATQAFRFCGSLGKGGVSAAAKKVPILSYLTTALDVAEAGLSVWKLYKEKKRTSKLKVMLEQEKANQEELTKAKEKWAQEELECAKILSEERIKSEKIKIKKEQELLKAKYESRTKGIISDLEVRQSEEAAFKTALNFLGNVIKCSQNVLHQLVINGEEDNPCVGELQEQLRLAATQYAKITKIMNGGN